MTSQQDRTSKSSNSPISEKGPKSYQEENEQQGEPERRKSQTMKQYLQQQYQQQQQQQPSQDLRMEDSIQIGSDKLNFISEKEFKYEKICWVCKIQFGKINERQHHCRLCSHSVCGVCSNKRVNENRACDVCFLKMKNVKGERRKKKLLQVMKNFIKDLSLNIKKGDEDSKKLKIKRDKELQKNKINEEQRGLELVELKAKLAQFESDQKRIKEKIEKEEDIANKKKAEKRQEVEKQGNLVLQLKSLQDAVNLKQQTLESKQNQLRELQKHMREIQETESFIRLPNYERAKRNDPEKICEAILCLDQNDLRNNIDHYNTISNDNLFIGSTSESSLLYVPGSAHTSKMNSEIRFSSMRQSEQQQIEKRQEYASSYNQGVVQDDGVEVIQHNARTGKKEKRAGKEVGCMCD